MRRGRQHDISQGGGQTALVSQAVAIAPSVIVRDANFLPIPNIGVTFAVTGG